MVAYLRPVSSKLEVSLHGCYFVSVLSWGVLGRLHTVSGNLKIKPRDARTDYVCIGNYLHMRDGVVGEIKSASRLYSPVRTMRVWGNTVRIRNIVAFQD